MLDRINDITWHAHQGSVAALIQVLNEKLANSGVRTRAIFDNGILQLLCEAPTVDKLEQSTLVNQIRQILDSIAPRNIHRVNINSRIVREQQLLWLEEISRNAENQLLWSEEITLANLSIFQQIIQDFSARKTELGRRSLSKLQSSSLAIVTNRNRHKNSHKREISGATSLSMFILLLGWVVYSLLGTHLKSSIQLSQASKLLSPTTIAQQKLNTSPVIATQNITNTSGDTFAAAVRIANQASTNGTTATTSGQWLDLAARWQRAAELMSAVPQNHSRYQEAQIRTRLYKKYSEAAQKEANKSEL